MPPRILWNTGRFWFHQAVRSPIPLGVDSCFTDIDCKNRRVCKLRFAELGRQLDVAVQGAEMAKRIRRQEAERCPVTDKFEDTGGHQMLITDQASRSSHWITVWLIQEFSKFDGLPMRYFSSMKGFENVVESKIKNTGQRLLYLNHHRRGGVRMDGEHLRQTADMPGSIWAASWRN